MRLPLPVRALGHDSAGLRAARFRTLLHRLWARLCAEQPPEECLTRARARAALRAEYEAHRELYPAWRGRRTLWRARRGGDRP